MSESNNQHYTLLMKDTEDGAEVESSEFQRGILEEFLEPFMTNDDYSNAITLSPASFDSYTQNMSEFSSDWSPISTQQDSPIDPSTVASRATTTCLHDVMSNTEHLQIVEQPYQSSKLRYRADYIREKGRLGALGNKNDKSRIKGPVIRIPQCYLNLAEQYYVRVSLVTVKHRTTDLHYFHPYELEHPRSEKYNDRQNNAVWFPIESKDCLDGLMNFPFLRIVKKKAFNVQRLDSLRVFDCYDNSIQNSSFAQTPFRRDVDFIQEYNLEKSQLAFTLGKKLTMDGQSSMLLYANTTIYSEEMNEYDEKQSDTDIEADLSPTDTPNLSSRNRYIYKYAPRSGVVGTNEEMLIFLRNKLEPRKYGNLQVVFEYDTFESHWSQSALDLEIKDRMISFKVPNFPYLIKKPTPVGVILRQDDRILAVLKYSYLPSRR